VHGRRVEFQLLYKQVKGEMDVKGEKVEGKKREKEGKGFFYKKTQRKLRVYFV
jgi:hypothetical protein